MREQVKPVWITIMKVTSYIYIFIFLSIKENGVQASLSFLNTDEQLQEYVDG